MIAIGSDHGGFELKNAIIKYFADEDFKDFGCYSDESCDYPDYARPVAEAIISGECDKGILVCGTGIGMSIAANRFKGIRASHCTDLFSAKVTREHNDSNILCLGARITDEKLALEMVKIWLETPFSDEDRHIRRIEKIDG